MRILPIGKLKVGDTLGKNLYSSDGQILLTKGVKLTPGYISKLHQVGVSYVYISEHPFKDIVVEDPIPDKVRLEAMAVLGEIADAVQMHNTEPLYWEEKDINKLNKNIDTRKLDLTVNSVVEELICKSNVTVHLANLKAKDDYLFNHSITVSILATLCGIQLGLKQHQLEQLALGCLLHDIGMVTINKEIMNKPVYLMNESEFAEYQDHSLRGFEILRNISGINILSAHIAFQHHEVLDGRGFPRKLKNEFILSTAKIAGVVDYFDSLLTGKIGTPMLPHQAYEVVMASASTKYDYQIVKAFSKHVALYPNGASVRLNTGEIGVVVLQTVYPTRPIVRVLIEEMEEEEKKIKVKEYDLTKKLTTFITEVIDG